MSSGESLARATEGFNAVLGDLRKKQRMIKKSAKHRLSHSIILGRYFNRWTINIDSWLQYNKSYLMIDGYLLSSPRKVRSRWAMKVLSALPLSSLWVINPHRNHIEVMRCTAYFGDSMNVSRERFDITWIREKYPELHSMDFKIMLNMESNPQTHYPCYLYRVCSVRFFPSRQSDRLIELPVKNPGDEQKRVLEL